MIHISHEHLKANVGFTLVFIRQTALHLKRKERETEEVVVLLVLVYQGMDWCMLARNVITVVG